MSPSSTSTPSTSYAPLRHTEKQGWTESQLTFTFSLSYATGGKSRNQCCVLAVIAPVERLWSSSRWQSKSVSYPGEIEFRVLAGIAPVEILSGALPPPPPSLREISFKLMLYLHYCTLSKTYHMAVVPTVAQETIRVCKIYPKQWFSTSFCQVRREASNRRTII